ncbi:MAG TPA: sulfotransferase family 2 domain-containing protein [Paracoccaceae bacterium]|nr:sulfotransferase family 2 domain-containing protein [Paracoccaceae bacterium]
MVVRVPRAKLAYYPIPKVACTSLKHYFFEVNHGRPFGGFRQAEGYEGSIHQYYPAGNAKHEAVDGLAWFVVLRDPFARAVSTYFNKIPTAKFKNRMEAHGFDFAASRLKPFPTLGEYLAHLAHYVADSALLRAHAAKVRRFCPDPLETADHVIRLEDEGALAGFIEGLTLGVPFEHRNATPRAEALEISRAEFEAAMEVLAPDYAFLSRWYVPPAYPG